MAQNTIEILIVEDNPSDARLTLEAFEESGIDCIIHIAQDGLEAKKLLSENAFSPSFILLDLNLPRMNGFELLEWLKEDEKLRKIPVAVLTTSAASEDVERVYQLHGNCFIQKPVDFDSFFNIVQSINHFWLSVANIPGGC